MSVGEICTREVIVVAPADSIRTAVGLMREHHVGDVVVVAGSTGQARPVGILTDRDIVIELVARDLDLDAVSVGDVMSGDLLCLPEEITLVEAAARMRDAGVRRAPVVSRDGRLVGLLATDDLLSVFAEELEAVSTLLERQPRREQRLRP